VAAQQGAWSAADKHAFQVQRLTLEMARGVHSATGSVSRFLAADREVKASAQLTADERAATAADKQPDSRDEMEAAAERGEMIEFAGDSTCFSDLTYQDGIVTATFMSGHGPYSQALDLPSVLDWFDDGVSAGGWFNDQLGNQWFAPRHKK